MGEYGGYILGFTNAILFAIILVLLFIIYKLKKKIYYDSFDDKIEITKSNYSSNPYKRKTSVETNELTYTRDNSNEENTSRFKLKREESKMSILEYPGTYDTNRKKREEPHTSTLTLCKIESKQQTEQNDVMNVNKDQISDICKGVLLKMQQKKEFTSLTNLESILSENNEENLLQVSDIADKSASTGLLDVVDSSEALPCPISVKKVIDNIETLQSPIPLKKLIKLAENNKADSSSGIKSHLPFRLPAFNTEKKVDAAKTNVDDSIQTNSVIKPFKALDTNGCNDDHLKYIKIDSPINISVSLVKNGDAQLDEIYDNPPKNIPVNNDEDDDDDIYGDFPNNRPVSHLVTIKRTDDIYDEVKSDKPVVLEVSSPTNKNKAGKEKINDTYDTLQQNENNPYFDSKYINAREYQK